MYANRPVRPDPALSIIVAILATAMGALATLMMVVLLIAAMPNGQPDELRWLRIAMGCTLGFGVAGAMGAVVGLAFGKPGLAAAIGFAPTLIVVALFAWLIAIGV